MIFNWVCLYLPAISLELQAGESKELRLCLEKTILIFLEYTHNSSTWGRYIENK